MVKPVLCIVDTGACCLDHQPIGLQQTIGATNLSRRSNAVPSSAPPPPPFSKIPALKKLLDPQTASKLDQFPAADASQSFTSPTVRYNLCRTRVQVDLDPWQVPEAPAPVLGKSEPLGGNLAYRGLEVDCGSVGQDRRGAHIASR